MGGAVLDASVIAALYVPEPHSSWARGVVERYVELHVLDLTLYELCNVLWKRAYLMRELRPQHVEALWGSIKRFIDHLCTVHEYREVLDQALDTSLSTGITVYDASYVALARRLGVRLVTVDRRLVERLKDTGLHDLLETPYT